jgi:hypothetical protein
MPSLPIAKSYADASLLAELMINKYVNHLPFYRQIQMFKQLGVSIPPLLPLMTGSRKRQICKEDKVRAEYALEQIGMLYDIERMADDKQLSYEERSQLRGRLAYPILVVFEKWIYNEIPNIKYERETTNTKIFRNKGDFMYSVLFTSTKYKIFFCSHDSALSVAVLIIPTTNGIKMKGNCLIF